IPMYQPHLTTGHGAIGKSVVELARAVAHVLGKAWLGMWVRQGPVIYLGADEEEDELHRRLEAILRHYGATFSDIVGGLHLLSYVGEDCLLGIPDNKGIIRPTEIFHRLLADVIRIGPISLTIDTLTDVYAGDEMERNETTQFVKLLQHMAIKARCSVAILAHPSNAGMATGSGLSGSTGWHNKVRSRLYMRSPTTAKGEEIDSDVREIQFLKNNYGKQGDSVQIRWEAGVFVLETGPASLERIARDRDDEHRFLDLLAKYDGQGRKMSHKVNAMDYAPRVLLPKRTASISSDLNGQWNAYSRPKRFTSRPTAQLPRPALVWRSVQWSPSNDFPGPFQLLSRSLPGPGVPLPPYTPWSGTGVVRSLP